jgi:hypothetical protein
LAASDAYEAAAKAHGAGSPEANAAGAVLSDRKGWWCATFATACAKRDARFGQRKKPSGTNYRRADGVLVSTDVLMWKDDGQIIDTMTDRGHGWSINPNDHQPVDQWVAALPDVSAPAPQPEPTPEPKPEPQPAPNPPPHDQSATEVMVSMLLDRVAKLEARVQILEQPRKVSTSRVWGHAHEIDLP